MPLLGPQEKGELQALILEQLASHFDQHGPDALLQPGLGVVVRARGASVEPLAGVGDSALGWVEIRSLFTAVCHLAGDGSATLPRDSLGMLASEAAGATAAQINRLSP